MSPAPRSRSAAIAAAFLCSLSVGAVRGQNPDAHPDELAIRAEVDSAIAKGVEWLLDDQRRDGTWGVHGDFFGGRTALCVYTLMSCGVRRDHPSVRRAMTYLEEVEPQKTYAVATMMLAFDAFGGKPAKRLGDLAERLVSMQEPTGDWGYPDSRPDLSNTQYAALGLWVALRNDIRIDQDVWRDLARGVGRYQETVRLAEVAQPVKEGRTAVTKRPVGGFAYLSDEGPTTGSMTTAGVSVLEICKLGLDRRLRNRERRELEETIAAGVHWLERHFRVDENPGRKGREYYYLYGLERTGALTRRELFGQHRWYVEGARHLIEKQSDYGDWNGAEDTCFSLLFLRRATAKAGPTTGGVAVGEREFAAGGARDSVRLRARGQQPLALWIDGFGDSVVERHREHGIRVLRVEYLIEGGRNLAVIGSDPTKAWRDDRFPHSERALERGRHRITAEITLVDPSVEPGESSPVEVVRSPTMEVEIRDVFEPWMERAARLRGRNLLRDGPKGEPSFELSASSNANHVEKACDGRDDTHWRTEPDDDERSLTIEFDDWQRIEAIAFAPAAGRLRDIDQFDRIVAAEVFVNGDPEPIRIEMAEDPIAITEFEFGKTRRVRSLRIHIAETLGDRGAAGFAEIALSGK